jgi:fibronectin type 3 domain-containing protein
MNAQDSIAPQDVLMGSLERFYKIPTTFGSMLKESQRNSSNRWNEAYSSFVAAVQTAQQETQKQLGEVQRTFQTAAQDTVSNGGEEKQYADAYRNYLELMNKACEEAQKRYEEAGQGFEKALAQLREEAQAESREAYRTYLQSMKDEWASLDVNAVIQCSGLGSLS